MSPVLEVLHVPDCANLAVMLRRLRRVADLPITTREIISEADAEAVGMSGSPTLLVNGIDPFRSPNQPHSALACRLYRDEAGNLAPVPSTAQLRDTLSAAVAIASIAST